MTTQSDIARHFDAEAERYDFWKKKNWYYYDALKDIAKAHYHGGALLDAGCGTGSIISAVAPERAVGIDISPEMVAIAKKRYEACPNYAFATSDIAYYTALETFDTILFFDVVEHLIDARPALRSMRELLSERGRLVVTMANPLWEPVLMAGEKLGMKMPEGPHYRMPTRAFVRLCEDAGLRLEERQWRLLFPKYVPVLSWLLNDIIGALPGVRRLSMIEVFVFSR